jgi:hypothetical protein
MKKYIVRIKRGRVFEWLKSIFRLFKKKPQIILPNHPLEDKAIYIANHSGASGPLTFELFFPKYFIPWGTHEMCGNYKMRWNYLYHVFYRQKLHYSKPKAFFLATTFGVISKYLYSSTGLIGTYKDVRLKHTFNNSIEVLNKNIPLLIFPEDSTNGYIDKPTGFFNGFIALAKQYHKRTNIDLPIYNVYYSKKKNKIIIDKPLHVIRLLKQGLTEQQISNLFLSNAHAMFEQHIAN